MVPPGSNGLPRIGGAKTHPGKASARGGRSRVRHPARLPPANAPRASSASGLARLRPTPAGLPDGDPQEGSPRDDPRVRRLEDGWTDLAGATGPLAAIADVGSKRPIKEQARLPRVPPGGPRSRSAAPRGWRAGPPGEARLGTPLRQSTADPPGGSRIETPGLDPIPPRTGGPALQRSGIVDGGRRCRLPQTPTCFRADGSRAVTVVRDPRRPRGSRRPCSARHLGPPHIPGRARLWDGQSPLGGGSGQWTSTNRCEQPPLDVARA